MCATRKERNIPFIAGKRMLLEADEEIIANVNEMAEGLCLL